MTTLLTVLALISLTAIYGRRTGSRQLSKQLRDCEARLTDALIQRETLRDHCRECARRAESSDQKAARLNDELRRVAGWYDELQADLVGTQRELSSLRQAAREFIAWCDVELNSRANAESRRELSLLCGSREAAD